MNLEILSDGIEDFFFMVRPGGRGADNVHQVDIIALEGRKGPWLMKTELTIDLMKEIAQACKPNVSGSGNTVSGFKNRS